MADVGDIRLTAALWQPRDRHSREQPDAPQKRAERDHDGKESPEREARRKKKGPDASRGTKFDEFA